MFRNSGLRIVGPSSLRSIKQKPALAQRQLFILLRQFERSWYGVQLQDSLAGAGPGHRRQTVDERDEVRVKNRAVSQVDVVARPVRGLGLPAELQVLEGAAHDKGAVEAALDGVARHAYGPYSAQGVAAVKAALQRGAGLGVQPVEIPERVTVVECIRHIAHTGGIELWHCIEGVAVPEDAVHVGELRGVQRGQGYERAAPEEGLGHIRHLRGVQGEYGLEAPAAAKHACHVRHRVRAVPGEIAQGGEGRLLPARMSAAHAGSGGQAAGYLHDVPGGEARALIGA